MTKHKTLVEAHIRKQLPELNKPTNYRITHGMSKTRPYRIWQAMKKRCTAKNCINYKYYGGKGIKVCSRWQSFENFWEDMKENYTDEMTIDRLDNSKDYSPKNCRWATPQEQKENTSRIKYVTYKGKTKQAYKWDEEMGYRKGTVTQRLRYGWDAKEAVETPTYRKNQHWKRRN